MHTFWNSLSLPNLVACVSAVYQPEINMCRIDVEGGEGWLNRSDINPERVRHSIMYGVPLDCMWVIRVKEGWKVRQFFRLKTLFAAVGLLWLRLVLCTLRRCRQTGCIKALERNDFIARLCFIGGVSRVAACQMMELWQNRHSVIKFIATRQLYVFERNRAIAAFWSTARALWGLCWWNWIVRTPRRGGDKKGRLGCGELVDFCLLLLTKQVWLTSVRWYRFLYPGLYLFFALCYLSWA